MFPSFFLKEIFLVEHKKFYTNENNIEIFKKTCIFIFVSEWKRKFKNKFSCERIYLKYNIFKYMSN